MSQKLEFIDLTKLKLDPKNPRLPKSMQRSDEKGIINWMLLEAATIELMTAIGQNDFFSGEQLLVVKNKSKDESYTVIEGNRRLTAVKLLSNPNLASVKNQAIKEILKTSDKRPNKIPCIVFDDKEEILKYLGFRHITGIKTWRLLEKSRYLTKIRDTQFKSEEFLEACKKLAKSIGSSSSYIKRLLIGYMLYQIIEDEGFYNIEGLDDTRFHLNYFVDSLNKENIRNHLNINLNNNVPLKNLNKGHLKELTFWWFDKKEGVSRVIGDSKGLKILNSVLGSEVALNSFRKGSNINEAQELTNDINILFQKEIEKALKSLERSDSLSYKITNFYDDLYDNLKSIRKIALRIKDFKDKLEKDGDDF